MEREALIALGTELGVTVTPELADKVIELHKGTLDNQYVPKARMDEVNEKNKTLTTQLSERDTSITNLKKDLENKVDQDKVTEVQKQLDSKDKEHAIVLEKKNKEIKVINLIAGKVHDNELVVGMLNLDNITIDEAGNAIGLTEQIAGLKQSKSFLFIDEKATPAADPNKAADGKANSDANTNPAAGVKSPNVATQPTGANGNPDDKSTSQRDAIINRMVAKQNLNRNKSKGDE